MVRDELQTKKHQQPKPGTMPGTKQGTMQGTKQNKRPRFCCLLCSFKACFGSGKALSLCRWSAAKHVLPGTNYLPEYIAWQYIATIA